MIVGYHPDQKEIQERAMCRSARAGGDTCEGADQSLREPVQHGQTIVFPPPDFLNNNLNVSEEVHYGKELKISLRAPGLAPRVPCGSTPPPSSFPRPHAKRGTSGGQRASARLLYHISRETRTRGAVRQVLSIVVHSFPGIVRRAFQTCTQLIFSLSSLMRP